MLRRPALVPSLAALALVVAPVLVACAGSSSGDAKDESEGALSLAPKDLLASVLGEASVGRTLPKDFAEKTAQEKQTIAWAKLTEPKELRCKLKEGALAGDALVRSLTACKVGSDDDDLRNPTLLNTLSTVTWEAFVGLLNQDGLLSGAFEPADADEATALRKKLLHPFGAVAKVELRIDSRSQFTGLLAAPTSEGTTRVPGLARMSAGAPEKLAGFLPGIGLKLFTSGGESADMHILPPRPAKGSPEAAAPPDYNVLAEPLSNEFARAGEPDVQERLFAMVHPTPLFLPIDHLGRRDVDGKVVASPSAPKHLTFDPNREASRAIRAYLEANPGADYRVALADATKNATEDAPVTLYTVRVGLLAKNRPADVEREFPAIGTLVATSPFIPSKWGDRQLYNRHHRGCTPVADGAKTAEAPSLCSGLSIHER